MNELKTIATPWKGAAAKREVQTLFLPCKALQPTCATARKWAVSRVEYPGIGDFAACNSPSPGAFTGCGRQMRSSRDGPHLA
jgi:hypothetical protein